MTVQVIYAKCKRGSLYRLELGYTQAGKYILRPTNGKAYTNLLVTLDQLKKHFWLFPIAGSKP